MVLNNDSKFTFVISFLILALISSCSINSEKVNEQFLQDYRNEVDRINQRRNLASNEQSAISKNPEEVKKTNSNWDNSSVNFGIDGTEQLKSAKVDTSKLKFLVPNREEFTPDMQTLIAGKKRSLPGYVFDISYNLFNYPASYGSQRISFDDIIVPAKDAFGVKSKLGGKNYTLVGKDNLQKNADYINSTSENQDKIISMILVKERKELEAKQRLRIKN